MTADRDKVLIVGLLRAAAPETNMEGLTGLREGHIKKNWPAIAD